MRTIEEMPLFLERKTFKGHMEHLRPQIELDNYKLQVELLEEKLQRSEDYRHHLEHKLEQILKKRSEHDKALRAKARQRYQQFLDEQEKRNERNKLLVQMLERIDEQSAALAARSERLKMLKLQHEMYFAKLVQAQTMRCMQQNAVAATAIPVLLPTSTLPATAASGPEAAATTPIHPFEDTAAMTTKPSSSHHYRIESSITSTIHTDHLKDATSSSNPRSMTPLHWTLALATPTPAGMLLTSTSTSPAATARLQAGDYIQYPIGYSPAPMQFAYQQHPGAGAGAGAAAGAEATARATASREALQSKVSADVVDVLSANRSRVDVGVEGRENSQHPPVLSKITDNQSNASIVASLETTKTSPTPTTRSVNVLKMNKIGTTRQESTGAAASTINAPSMLATSSASSSCPKMAPSTSLTFDKLPAYNGKDMAKTLPQSVVNAEEAAAAGPAMSAAAPAAEPSEAAEFVSYNKSTADALLNPRNFIKTDRIDNNNNNNNNKDINSHSRKVTSVKHDDVIADADADGDAEADTLADDADDEATVNANTSRRQKTDDAPEATITKTTTRRNTPEMTWLPATETKTAANKDPNINANTAAKGAEPKINRKSFDSLVTTSARQDEAATPTPTPTTVTTADSHQRPRFERKKKMSIENLEDAIYGELVQPVSTDAATVLSAESNKQAALKATSDLLEEFESVRPIMEAATAAAATESEVTTTEINDPTNEAMKADESLPETAQENYEHSSSQAEPNSAASEEYAAPQAGELYAADEAAGTQYQTYANEAQPEGSQDYDPNYDYQDYDAAAYQGAYGSNEYPGYTYDEATGQYTADEGTEQYSEVAYMQEYEASQQQQPQSEEAYDYNQYQEETSAAAPIKDHVGPEEPAAASLQQSDIEAVQAKIESTPTAAPPLHPTPIKPILSTEKSTANEAQQSRKKKRVNFVDSSETDDSSSAKLGGAARGVGGGGSSDSDFDFSTSVEPTNN